jgi:drug/metabolite transporter (DMT)-like permease
VRREKSVNGPARLHDPDSLGDNAARLMLVVLCLIWGISWPIMKLALDHIPPFSMRATSTALAALTLYLICLAKRRSFYIPNARTWAHIVISTLLNLVFFVLLIAFAQLEAATSRVAILAYTVPIWSVLFAWPVLGERPGRIQTFALGLCAIGLAVLIYPLATKGVPLGLVLALGAGVSWGAGTVYLKWARIDADPMGVTSWQLTISFVVIAACMIVFDGGPQLGAAGAEALLATVFIGVASGGIAYALWFEIVRKLPAATASLGVLGSPVIGVIASIPILGEVPTATDMVGFALIFAASACVMLAPLPGARKRSKPA